MLRQIKPPASNRFIATPASQELWAFHLCQAMVRAKPGESRHVPNGYHSARNRVFYWRKWRGASTKRQNAHEWVLHMQASRHSALTSGGLACAMRRIRQLFYSAKM